MNTIENTPAHCHYCHKFADCRQAKNMMANTPPEEGWLHDDGEVYCANCGSNNGDGTRYEGESDSPTHCSRCGVPIDHELTVEGVEYVCEALVENDGCCREVWATVWEDYL